MITHTGKRAPCRQCAHRSFIYNLEAEQEGVYLSRDLHQSLRIWGSILGFQAKGLP